MTSCRGQRSWRALFAGAALLVLWDCAAAENAVSGPIKIDSGLISGVVAGTEKNIRVYRGVPFAAPPVGELRWKAPQPVTAWEGVRACTEFSAWCPQPKPMLGRELGKLSEDCLYLNVWTPSAPHGTGSQRPTEAARGTGEKPTAEAARGTGEKLPVLVWIHGGGCTTGSGGSTFYDGVALARQGVVVVTINYRLGPFGFLAHPLLSKESEKNVSGNYGLLDQIAALEWVKRNIAACGGNPESVTIFGESAGSASVCRLMVSPPAQGLFQRAIAESGGAHGRNRHLRETRDGMAPMEKIGEQLAAKLGCDKEANPLAAMRAKSAEEILAASEAAQGLFGKGTKFGWIVDGWVLPDDPGAMWDAGKQANIPFMVGTNANEGTVFLQQLPIKRTIGYELMVRSLFKANAAELLKLFPARTDEEVPAALDHLVTVMAFVGPARVLARDAEKAGQKAYLYHFTRVPPMLRERKLGASHAAEIPYVFGNMKERAGFEDKDREVSKVMSACWVRFAATGDPNGPGLPEWPAYTTANDAYMEFGDETKAKAGLYKDACDVMTKVIVDRTARMNGE